MTDFIAVDPITELRIEICDTRGPCISQTRKIQLSQNNNPPDSMNNIEQEILDALLSKNIQKAAKSTILLEKVKVETQIVREQTNI